MKPRPTDNIVCVDCGGVCHLITFLSPDEPLTEGTVVAYRCEDCNDRWDLVWSEDEG